MTDWLHASWPVDAMLLTTNPNNTKLQKLAEEKGMESHQIHILADQTEEDKAHMDKVYVWKKPGFSVDLASLKEVAHPTRPSVGRASVNLCFVDRSRGICAFSTWRTARPVGIESDGMALVCGLARRACTHTCTTLDTRCTCRRTYMDNGHMHMVCMRIEVWKDMCTDTHTDL